MKKFFLLLGMLLSLTINAHATDSESSESMVFLEFQKKSQSQSNSRVNRTPIRFPQINVTFNPDENIIVIESSESIDVDVFLYDADGNVVDYSNTLNTTLQLLSNGEYTLYIEADSWYAIGYIN